MIKRILFRPVYYIVTILAALTGNARFTRRKLIIGGFIAGVIAGTASCIPVRTCYKPAPPVDYMEQANDSTQNNN
ncbi:MAG: hypothetical protein ABIJ16_09015 [Bacteroidota bacterium]